MAIDDDWCVSDVINEFDRFGILSHNLPNAIGMWPNEQECLVWSAFQTNPNVNWLEIGAFCGGSAVLLALAKQQFMTTAQVISIDNNFKTIFDFNVYQRGKFQDIVHKIECNSMDLRQYYNDPVSFVFLDGFHSFRFVVKEFELLLPLMTDDCVIGFHDISPNMWQHSAYVNSFSQDDLYYWMDDENENFRLDEAVSYICRTHDFHIIDVPVRNPDETHFQETRLNEWKRGETSPFNSYTAITRNK